MGSAQHELLCVLCAPDGSALLCKRTLMRAATSAMHARLGALRHALSERVACSGPAGVAGAGATPPDLTGVQLSAEEESEFRALVAEAEDLLEPTQRARGRGNGSVGGLPPLPSLGEAVSVLEQVFDAEHGVLDEHAPTAAWLHALLAPQPDARSG